MIRISSTLIKKLSKNGTMLDYCPAQIKAYLDGISDEKSIYMLRGSYAHWLVLGKHSREDDAVTDLPRLRTGEKSADQLRIELQAERCRQRLIDKGAIINSDTCERLIETKWEEDDNVILSTHSDIITPILRNGVQEPMCIIDLKFPGNLDSDYAEQPWKTPELIDWSQLVHSWYIFNKETGKNVLTSYWVYDYKSSPAKKILYSEITQDDLMQYKQTIQYLS